MATRSVALLDLLFAATSLSVAFLGFARSQNHHSSTAGCNGDASDDGVLAVLSYHSMEDKMAKRVMRDGSVDLFGGGSRRRGALERDIYGNVIEENTGSLPFEPLAKPRKATDEEVAANSRSRSATLRVAIRI